MSDSFQTTEFDREQTKKLMQFLREKESQLEHDLAQRIREFEEETRLTVTRIKLNHVHEASGQKRTVHVSTSTSLTS